MQKVRKFQKIENTQALLLCMVYVSIFNDVTYTMYAALPIHLHVQSMVCVCVCCVCVLCVCCVCVCFPKRNTKMLEMHTQTFDHTQTLIYVILYHVTHTPSHTLSLPHTPSHPHTLTPSLPHTLTQLPVTWRFSTEGQKSSTTN